MKKVTLLAATAAVGALIASPVLAQDSVQARSAVQSKTYKSKHMSHSEKMQMTHQARINGDSMAYRERWNRRGDIAFQDRRDNWRDRNWDNRSGGFWPADVVGGAVGTAGAIATGAVTTAGAIATAPFGGPYRDGYSYRDSYAFGGPDYGYGQPGYRYDGTVLAYSPDYAARNGFVCQPGTMFTNKAGQRQLCQ